MGKRCDNLAEPIATKAALGKTRAGNGKHKCKHDDSNVTEPCGIATASVWPKKLLAAGAGNYHATFVKEEQALLELLKLLLLLKVLLRCLLLLRSPPPSRQEPKHTNQQDGRIRHKATRPKHACTFTFLRAVAASSCYRPSSREKCGQA
jgi:hypothetical protein